MGSETISLFKGNSLMTVRKYISMTVLSIPTMHSWSEKGVGTTKLGGQKIASESHVKIDLSHGMRGPRLDTQTGTILKI